MSESIRSEDLRSKSVDELVKVVLDLRKGQFNSRFQKTQGVLENTAQVRRARRSVARVKTILNQKRREEAIKASSNEKAA